MVALTFVGSDTQHDRLEGEDERRVREGWVNKSHCHSLRSCMCVCARVCVYLYVDVLSARFVSLPFKTQRGQTAKWCSDG